MASHQLTRAVLVLIFLLWSLASHRLAAEGCVENERRALLAVKSDMYDPGGGRFSSWIGDDCCEWEGVACDRIPHGHVTKLDLHYPFRKHDDGGIGASKVNPSLLDLKHLKHLDLSMNDFAGVHLPEMLASLVHLEYLNLSNTMFSGPVPSQLGNLSSLHYLDLNNCDCDSRSKYNDSEARPPQLQAKDLGWLSQIPSLEYLDMSCADISRAPNWLQQINSIPSLQELHLGDARLPHVSPPLPPFNLTSIVVLDLSGCQSITTAALMWLSNASSLEYLHLQRCYFRLHKDDLEPLRVVLGSLLNLKSLNLSNCTINGDISALISRNVSRRLMHLDLSINSLAGNMPPSLWELEHLEYLNLSHNKLRGCIPQTLGNLTGLKHLDLARNKIVGKIPVTVGNLVHLEFLHLSDNHIVGELPPIIGNLTNLVYLRMGGNNISGRIPETLGNLIHLELLGLCGNNISGKIPEALGNLKSLRILWLCENSIHGQIPAVLGGLYNLQELDLSYNGLSGHIPPAVLYNLQELYLSYNDLSGQIPSTSGNLCNLRILYIHGNDMSGEITDMLDALSNCSRGARLERLSLDLNNFTGTIPLSLGQLSSLRGVSLNDNSFAGNITEAHFSNLTHLGFLDLSYYSSINIILPNDWIPPFNADNIFLDSCRLQVTSFPSWIRTQTNLKNLILTNVGLGGDIPSWFSDQNFAFCNKNFRMLELSSNSLTGNIPECHASFPTSLLSLRLDNNSLSGPIPPFLKHCTQLKILDLGDNRFSGEVPTWLGGLSSLRVLRLSSNRFHGMIPLSIGNLTSLQVLDLSSNNFSGGIPPSLGNIRAMIVPQNDNVPIFRGQSYLYFDDIFITAKRLSYKYTISQVTSIDFSNNILSGEIPSGLTNLVALHFLNLSRNHITGSIPQRMGSMKLLESLDLSMNDLTGEIPLSISDLSFLGSLNLSQNNLSGRIPMGRQLSTLNDPSIYAGNEGLCGVPLPACRGDHATALVSEQDGEGNSDELERIIDWSGTILGFVIGFWSFIGVMISKGTEQVALL